MASVIWETLELTPKVHVLDICPIPFTFLGQLILRKLLDECVDYLADLWLVLPIHSVREALLKYLLERRILCFVSDSDQVGWAMNLVTFSLLDLPAITVDVYGVSPYSKNSLWTGKIPWKPSTEFTKSALGR